MEIKEYLEERMNEKTEILNSQIDLTIPMFYEGDRIRTDNEFDYSNMKSIISCYKSLSEILELFEIYTSNFNDKDVRKGKEFYNKYMVIFEKLLDDIIKHKLTR